MTQVKLYFSLDTRDEKIINEFLSSDPEIRVLQVIHMPRGNSYVSDLLIVYEKPTNETGRPHNKII